MSDDEDRDDGHEGRGHRSGRGGRGVSWPMVVGWGVAGLLAANLIWGKLREEGGRPQGFLSERIVLAAALWLPVAAAAAAAGFGVWWSVQTYRRKEKSSTLWQRNAFIASLVALAVLIVAVQDARNFPRQWLAAAAAIVVAAQTGFFAYAAFREYRRTTGHGGGRSRSHGDRE